MAPGRIVNIGVGYMENLGICTEVTGKNCGIYSETPNLKHFYLGG